MSERLKSLGLWVFCFGKGKGSITGAIITAAPVVLRNMAEQLQLSGFPDKAAMITSLVGVGIMLAGLARKAVARFFPPDTPCL